MLKDLLLEIRKELVFKLDFITGECEIGWIWIIITILQFLT